MTIQAYSRQDGETNTVPPGHGSPSDYIDITGADMSGVTWSTWTTCPDGTNSGDTCDGPLIP